MNILYTHVYIYIYIDIGVVPSWGEWSLLFPKGRLYETTLKKYKPREADLFPTSSVPHVIYEYGYSPPECKKHLYICIGYCILYILYIYCITYRYCIFIVYIYMYIYIDERGVCIYVETYQYEYIIYICIYIYRYWGCPFLG